MAASEATTIRVHGGVATLVNVFTVEPENQQALGYAAGTEAIGTRLSLDCEHGAEPTAMEHDRAPSAGHNDNQKR